eukprot:TRINITY_DN63216_c0_g1_i1.p1 TRINITY_DN63216_c0_g1~~TRINITY_DN63216_c0_g1_i1.p1  ORF type:complete len:495 (+),score=163.62 TRINITY_DN63216_c0_g1_i1:95-1579(+)
MALSMHMKADRAILKRQKEEFHHEARVASGIEQFKVEQKGLWENKTAEVIRNNRVKSKAAALRAQQKAALQQRREKLARMLSEEQRAYEQEMVDREETPQQRMDKMAVRAFELKKRREDERKAFVQEKLYQQWRDGIDELRTMDTHIVQLKTIAARDQQLDEKQVQRDEDKACDQFYAQLWHEGYLAKIEREEREKAMRVERNEMQKATLAMQLEMKDQRKQEDRDAEDQNVSELKKLWAAQEQEEKDAVVREKVRARTERAKADEYMAIQQAQRAEEERVEKQFDKDFVANVLDRERKVAEMEENERQKAKKKAVEYTEALKVEMAKKAASEEELIRMQAEESERQWAKRYAQWEKEELARRALMKEVYSDRAEQVMMKQEMRSAVKNEVANERERILAEVKRLEEIEAERERGEALVAKRHQEELFRQMDFHQVKRHQQLQMHAIEQRSAAIAEEKIRRAVKAEKEKSISVMTEVMEKRKAQRAGGPAPWEK